MKLTTTNWMRNGDGKNFHLSCSGIDSNVARMMRSSCDCVENMNLRSFWSFEVLIWGELDECVVAVVAFYLHFSCQCFC